MMRMALLVAATVLLAPRALPTGAFENMPGESMVQFLVKDNRGGFTGETREIETQVTVREHSAQLYIADVEAKIDARTLRTGSSLRDGQMRGPMFLRTSEFPFITFTGVASAQRPEGREFRGSLRGRLSVRGVTREIEVPLEITVDGDKYSANGQVVVRITDFSIPIPRFLIFVAEDPVTVRLEIRLRPKSGT